ncbi:MAG: hypothetical protein A2520_03155 [Deltaproteobacteria bacterium RIFOXYD12_FULL_53_23]|nr:MAG: hypothetical protein A2520_03155 [Deltaproteobacteria bacterium RIFOXYD12_FULL_53_23]
MKIVYVRSYFSKFKTLYDYLEEALQRAGHEVYPFDYRAYGIPSRIRKYNKYIEDVGLYKINRDFTRLVEEIRPDMLLMLHGFTITASTLQNLKEKYGMITVNWLCDYPREFDIACHYASLFDHFLVSGSDALRRLRLAGHKNVHLFPFACEPLYHKPVELSAAEAQQLRSDICFVGSMYPGRMRMLEKISDFDIAIWGPRWKEEMGESPLRHSVRGGSLDVEEWVKVYGATKIALNNISSFAPYVDNMMNTRVFEIMACKKLQLVDTRDDILMAFTSGDELVCYSSIDELRSQIVYYLEHPEKAQEIAESGYRKVMQLHTYDHRVQELMAIINK